jgi:hypothetical protein
MNEVFSYHGLWMSGWAFAGMMLGAAGIFAWTGQADSRGLVAAGVPGVPPAIDARQPGKYETATFGMG